MLLDKRQPYCEGPPLGSTVDRPESALRIDRNGVFGSPTLTDNRVWPDERRKTAMIFVGTDEAGYGPNLGPLMIAATVWQMDGADHDFDFSHALRDVVATAPFARTDTVAEKLVVADSKCLYSSGKKRLDTLEMGLFPMLARAACVPESWRECFSALAPESQSVLGMVPWYRGFDCALPLHADSARIAVLAERCRRVMDDVGLRLIAIGCDAIFPEEFNSGVDAFGNKAELLSHRTLALIRKLTSHLPLSAKLIQCDKHGGRNRYAPLLQQFFPEHLVEIYEEGREFSRYRWGPATAKTEFRFVAKGEAFLPAALASMAAKYLRELAMAAFNAFWREHVPGLKPTAGYPADARRFREDIREIQHQLGIDDRVLWRNR